MFKSTRLKKSGFTLVEILVVVAIIGILATLVVVSLGDTRAKARDSQRISDIKQMQVALRLYFSDQGYYPSSSTVTSSIYFGDTVYMDRLPQAPTPPDGDCTVSDNQYVYSELGENNESYSIYFCLGEENSNLSAGLAIANPTGIEHGPLVGLQRGLVGHWALDNIDGLKDKSSSGNDGTGFGGITIGSSIDRYIQAGGATSFDGSNDYIDVPMSLNGVNNFTISLWVRLDSVGSDNIIDARDGVSSGFTLFQSSSGFTFRLEGHDLLFTDTDYINSWRHIVMSYDTATQKLYVNGVVESQNISASNVVANPIIRIGARSWTVLNYVSGEISDVRIYNRTLSSDEVALLYESSKPTLTDGLVAWWALDNVDGLNDKSGNGNNGTAKGGITIGGATDYLGRSGRATSFDNIDDVIDFSNNINLVPRVDNMTFTWWSRVDSGVSYLWAKTANNLQANSQYRFAFSLSEIVVQVGGSSAQYSVSNYLGEGWFFYTLTIPAATSGLKLYINTELQSITAGNDSIGSYTNSFPFIIGARNDSNDPNLYSLFLDGSMADFRVYNRILSQEEIEELYLLGQ
ncbi:MAG: LamG-like jellyroll fold domain-containing protein [Patescibacteria group bacterium]|jgi:prepilin-type N-terminal cleavage/methylation domain-containing protein